MFLLAMVSAKRVASLNNLSIAPGMVDMMSSLVWFTPSLLEEHNRPNLYLPELSQTGWVQVECLDRQRPQSSP